MEYQGAKKRKTVLLKEFLEQDDKQMKANNQL